jgi:Killing trait
MRSASRLDARQTTGQKIMADSQPSTSNDPQTLATAPAATLGKLYSAIGQALTDAALNAVSAQQQGQIIAQAAMSQGISTLFAVDTAALGLATKKEVDSR